MALVTATDLTKQADLATRISFASILAATPTLPILMNEASLVEAQLIAQLSAEPDFAAALTSRLYPKPSHDEVVASLRDEPSLAPSPT
jgi:hypothetical protein